MFEQEDDFQGPPGEIQPSTGEQLVRAVQEHRVVTFRYHGLRRTVEPHLVGIHEAGEAALVGYQTEGFSASGELPGWRTFIVAEIEDLEVTDRTFQRARPDFNVTGYTEIFARG